MKNENLFAALRAAFPDDLDATAIETADTPLPLLYTWRDLERGTAMLANLLQSLELPEGARVAVQTEKSVEALMLYLAVLRAGYVYLPMNTAYQPGEVKINLSVRTKLVSGMLRRGDDPLRDSLWFGYTQQSHWQLFNKDISRPFRNTDHEPELTYVFPHFLSLPGGWTYRMTGVGVVHQSNGQSLPLSRSWNRAFVMGAADKITDNGDRFTLQARVWRRMDEKPDKDDNPDISDFVGRGEIVGRWSFDSGVGTDKTLHTLGLALRHSLRSSGRGSARLDYLRSIGRADTGLRFHAQLFSGYGDSLIDYNRRRTVFSAGLSLVDW